MANPTFAATLLIMAVAPAPPVVAAPAHPTPAHSVPIGPARPAHSGHTRAADPGAMHPSADLFASVRSVTSAQIDSDGIEDLVVALDTPSGPEMAVYRGNLGAIYPYHPGAINRRDPFLRPIHRVPSPLRGDFLEAADFTGDGNIDILIGGHGAHRVALFEGRGDGTFSAAVTRDLGGPLTALAAGSYGAADGRTSVAAGVAGARSATLLFRGSTPGGAWHATAETLLSHPGRKLAFGPTSRSTGSVAVLGSHVVTLLDGNGAPRSRIADSTIDLGFGRFGPRGEWRLALVSTGALTLVDPESMQATGSLPIRASDRILGAGYRSGGAGHDLLLSGRHGTELIPHAALALAGERASLLGDAASALPQSPVLGTRLGDPASAAAVMRLNADALADIVLATGAAEPAVLTTSPMRTFVVNNPGSDADGDLDDGICDLGPDGDGNYTGVCTLPAAIDQAESSAGADLITFALPGSGPFALPSGGMSELSDAVTIDGTSQPGYAGAPLIVLTDATVQFRAGNSVIRGVILNVDGDDFRPTASVDFSMSGNNTVESSWIGVDPTGQITDPDGTPLSGDELGPHYGVWIRTAGNTVGGSSVAARNVISGASDGDGILISSQSATGNVVQNNYIGTDALGSSALGNYVRGVSISNGASGNTVRDNLISGNGTSLSDPTFSGAGVALQFNSMLVVPGSGPVDLPPVNNLVVGNLIGTNAAGSAAIPNVRGVLVDFAQDNTVGGLADSLGNTISGNTREGVVVRGQYGTTTGNSLLNNYVGVASDGSTPLANGTDGIRVSDAGAATIAGGNVVSSNGSRGVAVERSSDITISGNRIGSDDDGLLDRGNSSSGIQIASSTSVVVGTSTPTDQNLISANGGGGIFISGNTTGVTVQGNLIGTDATGEGDLGNGFDGVRILGNSGHLIGGTEPGQGNTIAFNALNGIGVFNGSGYSLYGNAIFENGSLGIDLGINDVTANDEDDSDEGPNDLQNFPYLGFLDSERVRVIFRSAPSTPYRLEFFANRACDASDYGEGRRFLGGQERTTDGDGYLDYETSFTLSEDEQYVTATATGPGGSTSEFSRCSDDFRLRVNTTGDAPDADPLDPVCDTGTDVLRNGDEEPECTLRAALGQANANQGADEITFDIIQGSAPFTVAPASALPASSDSLVVDATTQPGYASGTPVVVLQGQTGMLAGFESTAGASQFLGLDIRGFERGLFVQGAAVRLHDVRLADNRSFGLLVTGDEGQESVATGVLTLERNGPTGQDCEGFGGASLAGSLTTQTVTAIGNCGIGLGAAGGVLTIDGDATISENDGWGIRADELFLNAASTFAQNTSGAISVNEHLEATGELTVQDNGPVGTQACTWPTTGAVIASTITTRDATVTDNCGSGLWAESGDLTVVGDVSASRNRVAGLRSLRDITLRGDEHFIEGNGLDGILALEGRVSITGAATVQFNGTEVEAVQCGNTGRAGIAAHALDAEHLTSHANCGQGVFVETSLTVSTELRLTENGHDGAWSRLGPIQLSGATLVASGNGRHGIFTPGAITHSGSLSINNNAEFGIDGFSVDLSQSTGTICGNGSYGALTAGGPLLLGNVTVCNNGAGGILGTQAATTPMTKRAGAIVGATIVANNGDGIRLEGGDVFSVTGSNLYGNAGLAINNVHPSGIIAADGNWWGSTEGPAGQVAGAVTASSFLDDPVVSEDTDGDGVPDVVEDLGPADGDADGDGTPDRAQAEVASIPSAVDGRTIVITAQAPARLSGTRALRAPVDPASHPAGFIQSTVLVDAGASATLELRFPPPADAYTQFGVYAPAATGADASLFAVDATIEDSTVAITLTDGVAGDADLEANGQILLVGGPGTMSQVGIDPAVPGTERLRAVYPNPFSERLLVRAGATGGPPLSIEVFDILGRKLAGRTVPAASDAPLEIDTSRWPSGVYFLRLTSQNTTETRTILKVR